MDSISDRFKFLDESSDLIAMTSRNTYTIKSVTELNPVSSMISLILLYSGFGIFIVTLSCALIYDSYLSVTGLS
jgi:hypothetical protein